MGQVSPTKFILTRLFVTCRSIKNLPRKRDNQVMVSSITQLKSYLRPGGADGEDTCHWNRNRPRPSDLCPSEKPASTGASGTLEWNACRNITTNPTESLYYRHKMCHAAWYSTCIPISSEDFLYLQLCGLSRLRQPLHLWQRTRLPLMSAL